MFSVDKLFSRKSIYTYVIKLAYLVEMKSDPNNLQIKNSKCETGLLEWEFSNAIYLCGLG